MKNLHVYLVEGSTGKYVDYQMWIAKAFATRKAANAYCRQLTTIANTFDRNQDRWKFAEYLRKYDAHASVDYNGVEYSVSSLKVEV